MPKAVILILLLIYTNRKLIVEFLFVFPLLINIDCLNATVVLHIQLSRRKKLYYV